MKATPSTQEDAVLGLVRRRGLLRAREAAALKLPTVVITRLVRSGRLARVGRGLYSLPDVQISAQHELAQVALRAPRGVVCLLTALRVHEIGTQSPFQVWLALPPGISPPRMTSPQLRVVRMSGVSLTEGITLIKIDGVPVPVFDAAKTIVDCFKYRNKIGLDVALEALREGWRERKANKLTMDALWRYAEIDRVAGVMRPYLESLV